MFSRIFSVVPDGSRRFLLKYTRMVNSITDRMVLAKNRYMLAHPIQTQGVEMLRRLILNLDIAALDRYKSDVDRYTEVIKFFKMNFRNFFDPIYSGSIVGGKWIRKGTTLPPNEILLNCECAAPLDEFPFDRGWEEWQDLRAFRMLYHDSLELPEDYAQSLLHFKEKIPNLLVVSLDVPILLFKYYKYVKDCQENGSQPNANSFIKDYELSNIFDDLYEIWTLNLLQFIFSHPETKFENVTNVITMPIRFCTGNVLLQGFEGIKEFVELTKNGSIQFKDFLETRWFISGSLKDKLNELDRWVVLPDNHKYIWLEALEYLPYLKLFLTVVKMFPDAPIAETVRLRCKEVWIKKFKYVRVYNVTPNENIKEFIEKLNTEVEGLLKN